MGSLVLFFKNLYFLQCYMQKVKLSVIICFNYTLLTLLSLICIRCLVWVRSYANGAKCKQWCQQEPAYIVWLLSIGTFVLQLSIDDISRYGDAYRVGNHGAAFSNLKVAMETANSSAVLPSVEVLSSGRKSDELVQLIRELANGLVKEFSPEGNFTWNGFCGWSYDILKEKAEYKSS